MSLDADDFKLKHVSTLFEADNIMHSCAEDAREWMTQNKLFKVNDNKTEFLVIAPRHRTIQQLEVTIRVDQTCIYPCTGSSVRNLGVIHTHVNGATNR